MIVQFIGLAIVIIAIAAAFYTLWQRCVEWEVKYTQRDLDYFKLLGQKKSSEVRLGQISEQLAPFLQEFKYDPKQTHFLGMPIDFICFQPDKVVFLEVKSGKAQLNPRQREIKQLILDKKVEWDEMRIDGSTETVVEGNPPKEGISLITTTSFPPSVTHTTLLESLRPSDHPIPHAISAEAAAANFRRQRMD
jgi:hypothetical protein